MILQAGPVQALYDKGFLRYIQTAGREVVRMIYFAVRDQDWNTISGTLTDERIQTTEETFAIEYTYLIREENIHVQWQAKITGQADGTITFAVHGKALSSFLTNRAGCCVLHPLAGVTGQPCRVEHPDGSFTNGTFPTYICPHQPFTNIKALEWPVVDQGVARLEFSGDVFETEDQRNWTDASFKTYCTPLSRPFPAWLHVGDEIDQQVVFRWVQPVPASPLARTLAAAIPIIRREELTAFPAIGVGINQEQEEPTPAESAFLQSVGLNHLRAEINLTQATWREQWRQATRQSATLGLPLELALFFGENAAIEVAAFVEYMQPDDARLQSVLLFDAATHLSTDVLLATVAPVLRTALPNVLLGGGTNGNFVDFNRHPFTYSYTDFSVYAINPQVHAFDDLTLIENAAAQADTVQTARHVTNNQPVRVSPVTLRPRFNAVATSGQTLPPAPADFRQPTVFTAGWTLASLKYLAEAGAAGVTYFETTGARGICRGDQPYAVGYLLRYILQFNPQWVIPTRCPEPLKVTSLLLQRATTACLLLTNHTPEPQLVELPAGFKGQLPMAIGVVNKEDTATNLLTSQEVTLSAYQTVALEGKLL